MLVKKSALAKLANVSRQIVYRLCDDGQLVANADGLLDTDNPVNRSYIMRHNASALQHLQASAPTQTQAAIDPPITPQPQQAPITKRGRPRKQQPPEKEKRQSPVDDSATILSRIAAAQGQADQPDGLSPAEMRVVLKRAYYETAKIKNDAEKRAIEIDRLNDLLVEKEIVIEYLTELAQSIQRNFIDSDTKQAVTICAALGAIGHENDVIEILAEDNGRRIEEVKRLAEKAVRKKHNAPKRDEVDEAAAADGKDEDE
jgi:hypothetical protein